MKLRILPSAKQDLHRGFRFYERRESGIGSYFLDSLYSDIDSICVFGGIHRRVGELFRFKSKRFPFWIYYRLDGDIAYVVAVLDALGRHPGKSGDEKGLNNKRCIAAQRSGASNYAPG